MTNDHCDGGPFVVTLTSDIDSSEIEYLVEQVNETLLGNTLEHWAVYATGAMIRRYGLRLDEPARLQCGASGILLPLRGARLSISLSPMEMNSRTAYPQFVVNPGQSVAIFVPTGRFGPGGGLGQNAHMIAISASGTAA